VSGCVLNPFLEDAVFVFCLFVDTFLQERLICDFLTQAPQSAAAGVLDPAAPRGQFATHPLLTRLFMTGGGDLKPPGGP